MTDLSLMVQAAPAPSPLSLANGPNDLEGGDTGRRTQGALSLSDCERDRPFSPRPGATNGGVIRDIGPKARRYPGTPATFLNRTFKPGSHGFRPSLPHPRYEVC